MKTPKGYPATCEECGYKGPMEENLTWLADRAEWVCDACLDMGIPKEANSNRPIKGRMNHVREAEST